MKHSRRLSAAVFWAVIGFTNSSFAQTAAPAISEATYAATNIALAEQHVAPRYAALSDAATDFKKAAARLCRQPPPRQLSKTITSFHGAMNTWMSVAHIQHGPIQLFMRQFRIYYWPDKRGRGRKQLRNMMAERDEAVLAPGRLENTSVAVQGLSAAEHILFDKTYAKRLIDGSESDYACKLLSAIAQNVEGMTAELAEAWRGEQSMFLNEIRAAGTPASRFATHREATAAFVKGMHTSLQTIADLKLARALGKALDKARPKQVEAWRSGRSIENIVQALGAMRSMYEGTNGGGLRQLLSGASDGLAVRVSNAFTKSLGKARALSLPLGEAVRQPASRKQVEALLNEVRTLQHLVRGSLALAFGTPLGFNSLDGD